MRRLGIAAALLLTVFSGCGSTEAAPTAAVKQESGPVPWVAHPDPKAPAVYGTLPQYDPIEVRLHDVPPKAKIGEELRFVIALENPSERAVPLAPCPTFYMAYGETAVVVNYKGRLNCAQAPPVIPAGGEVRFEMRLFIEPVEDLIPGFQGTLFWRLTAGTLPKNSVVAPLYAE